MNRLLLLALTSLWFGNAAAATHATTCNGCTDSAMLTAATRATSAGTVYVFNATNTKARKYSVQTEIISLKPYWAFTYADELVVETDVKSTFTNFVNSQSSLSSGGVVVLPPDFPVRSAAGAMLEPGSTATRIADYLATQSSFQDLEMKATLFAVSILKRNIPLFNLSDIMKVTKLIVEFADGSTVEYELFFSTNVLNGTSTLEVRLYGNARMENGTPAPTGPIGFSNFNTGNVGQSLHEWVLWARANGVPVTDGTGGTGTRMSCSISGSAIHCIVTRQ